LRAHTFKEMLEVQAKLRRDSNALKEASIEQAGD
jgi:hypothetical protein